MFRSGQAAPVSQCSAAVVIGSSVHLQRTSNTYDEATLGVGSVNLLTVVLCVLSDTMVVRCMMFMLCGKEAFLGDDDGTFWPLVFGIVHHVIPHVPHAVLRPTPLSKQHWALLPPISWQLPLLGQGGGGGANPEPEGTCHATRQVPCLSNVSDAPSKVIWHPRIFLVASVTKPSCTCSSTRSGVSSSEG